MAHILECFDGELVDRAKAALNEARVGYTLTVVEQESLVGWQIDVSDADSTSGAAIIETVAQALESERSTMRCSQCGTGMISVGPVSEKEEEGPLFLEYRCPKCGNPGISCVA
jgi:Zn finger protein HypA/HybF involved in hydrogenase expression